PTHPPPRSNETTFRTHGFLIPLLKRTENLATTRPEQPNPQLHCHLEGGAVTSTDFAKALCDALPPGRDIRGFQQLAGLAKVSLRSGEGLETSPQLLAAFRVHTGWSGIIDSSEPGFAPEN